MLPFFGWFPFGGLLGFIVPFMIIFVAVRLLRTMFRAPGRHLDWDRWDSVRGRRAEPALPLDDVSPASRYGVRSRGELQGQVFRLAREMKGRITLSDIVIATSLGIKEAEELIEGMVDGVHVTMEVNDRGRVVYEFPEIISRYGEEE